MLSFGMVGAVRSSLAIFIVGIATGLCVTARKRCLVVVVVVVVVVLVVVVVVV